MMEIKLLDKVTAELESTFSRLMPQLAPDVKIPSADDLNRIVSNPNTFLFLACNPEIVGSITLAIVKTPSGSKAWIEDVVVDQDARGQQVGEKMLLHAIEFAKNQGISSINLTSTPNRIAANQLYLKLGFALRETNVYRLVI